MMWLFGGFEVNNIDSVIYDINKKIKLDVVNKTQSDTNNYNIFESIILELEKINKSDIIVIVWESVSKFRLVSNFSFKTIDSNFDFEEYKNINLSKKTIIEFANNRNINLENYIFELNDYIKLINFYFKNNLILHITKNKNDFDLGLNAFLIDSNKESFINFIYEKFVDFRR